MPFKGPEPTEFKCEYCSKTIYVMELVSHGDEKYHAKCFKCAGCDKQLTINDVNDMQGTLFCKPCFNERMKSQGRRKSSTCASRGYNF